MGLNRLLKQFAPGETLEEALYKELTGKRSHRTSTVGCNRYLRRMKTVSMFLAFWACCLSNTASAIENIYLKVGETKTLYLPYSVTSKTLKSVDFISYGVDCVSITSQSNSWVTIKAIKKTPSSGVIVRCSYIYYVLRNGRYVYGGIGAYDYNVKVTVIEPTNVSLPNELNLQPGESRTLTPTLYPSNATTEYTWESSSYSTVNVWQNGHILAQKKGTSIITVTTSNGKQAKCKVVVGTPDVMPTSVSITSNISSIKVGDVASLTAYVYPTNATDKSVTWSSSNPSVISVNASTGQITGHKAGYSTITVKTCNGLTSQKQLECKENVTTITLHDTEGFSGSLPSVAHVHYERKFLKGWNSMCVPFAVTESMLKEASANLRMAIVKEIEVEGDRRNIVLQSVHEVKAGQPCLVYATSDATWSVALQSVALANLPISNSLLRGNYSAATIGAGCAKISHDGLSFGWTKTASAKVYPFRCYIQK